MAAHPVTSPDCAGFSTACVLLEGSAGYPTHPPTHTLSPTEAELDLLIGPSLLPETSLKARTLCAVLCVAHHRKVQRTFVGWIQDVWEMLSMKQVWHSS